MSGPFDYSPAAIALKLAAARAVLRALEWSDYDETGVGPLAQDFCPTCGEHKSNGHDNDCALAAVLYNAE